MQMIESIMFLLAIVGIGFLIKYKSIKRKHMISLLVLVILLLTFHLIFESARWQLYPLYAAILLQIVMIVILVLKRDDFIKIKITRHISLATTGLLVLLFVLSNIVLPVNEMKIPSGGYSIGTKSFVVTDEDRSDVYDETGNRKIKVQVWYPAESTEGYELVPWLEDGKVVAKALAKDFGLPSFTLNHTELIMSNSYWDAPISNDLDSYPVVVISHGWRGFRNLHTDLAEELASVGYIVFSIDHTSGSVATVFSDEDISYINLDALPERETTSLFLEFASTLVTTYADDITLTLNELEKMDADNSSSKFEGKLDLSRIGLLGHSTGGGAGVEVAINDDRIKAVVGMDAWVEPIANIEIDKGLDTPSLFIRSGTWETGLNNSNLYRLIDEGNGNALLYQVDGTTHYDYSMAYMYSPFTKNLEITGELKGTTLALILDKMIVSFFDEKLMSKGNTNIMTMDELWKEVQRIK